MREIAENASLFIFGTNEYMAIGGGGWVTIVTSPAYLFSVIVCKKEIHMIRTRYGLSLDRSLSKGTTGLCFTFDNKPLTGTQNETFEVRSLEVFAFIQ
jgi:hypothetical protein